MKYKIQIEKLKEMVKWFETDSKYNPQDSEANSLAIEALKLTIETLEGLG